MDMNLDAFYQKINSTGLVPVVVIEDAGDAFATALALLSGGIDMMEITFRTACAKEAIAIVKEKVPDMLVGAGTILNVSQASEARHRKPSMPVLLLSYLRDSRRRSYGSVRNGMFR